ncbi:6-phosphogluconolactonase [bacterium]|nr:6-phosphogluconolactonase [bacterium]
MSQPKIEVFADGPAVARAALQFWIERHSRGGPFWVSLAGGTTPKELYRMLAEQPLNWTDLHLLWGDERFVPPDHADSNFRMVKEAWLDRISGVGESHPWKILETAEASAEDYEKTLRAHPQGVDLCLLGMGDDGHTASLFPDSKGLDEKNRWAIANWVEKFNSHRLSMTYPYLNLSKEVLFLVTGAGKAAALREVLRDGRHPAAGVRGREATYFFVDQAAAAELGG